MKAEEAFSILDSLEHAALEKHQFLGAELFGKSDFEGAQAVAEQAQQINLLVLDLEKLRANWAKVIPEPTQTATQPSLDTIPQVNEFTPHSSYRIPILQALIEMEGKGKTQKVIDRVGKIMKDILTEADCQKLPSGQDIRWRNNCAWHRYSMKIEGLLRNDSKKGIWEISAEGREFFQSQLKCTR